MGKIIGEQRKRLYERLRSPFLPKLRREIGNLLSHEISKEEIRRRGYTQRTISNTESLLTKPFSRVELTVSKGLRDNPGVRTKKELARAIGKSVSYVEQGISGIRVKTGMDPLPPDFEKIGAMGPPARRKPIDYGEIGRHGVAVRFGRPLKKRPVKEERVVVDLKKIPEQMRLKDGRVLDLRRFASMLAQNPSDMVLIKFQNGDLRRMLKIPEIRRVVVAGVKKKSILGRAKELLEEKRK